MACRDDPGRPRRPPARRGGGMAPSRRAAPARMARLAGSGDAGGPRPVLRQCPVGGRRAHRRSGVGLGTPDRAAGDRHGRAPRRGGRLGAARALRGPASVRVRRRPARHRARRRRAGLVRDLPRCGVASPGADGAREAPAPALAGSGISRAAPAPDARAVPLPADRRRVRAADADVDERHAVHRAALRQAAAVHPQERVLAAGWLTFGALLFGRWRYGWRGRVALRWIIAGTVFVFLAYLGYKFVLEVLLGR